MGISVSNQSVNRAAGNGSRDPTPDLDSRNLLLMRCRWLLK